MAPDSRPDDLATALARMARDLLTQRTEQQTLDRIVAYAVDLVDGCDSAGVLAIEAGSLRTLAATDDVAVTSDKIQLELGEGPCLDSTLRDERVYRIADMATDTRWRRYASRAQELGIGSAMGFLLYTRERNLGALNLYGRNRKAFGERSEHIGWLLASHAAVAFASARSDAQLQQAIASRQEIGEALGIMMERRKISEQEAFDLLRRRSQDRNVKLRDLARQLPETGELPDG
jgi:transcriptional regulator with GAF, ATPase, and Fis domain